MRWIATCPDETKSVLAAELAALGVQAPRLVFRGVVFEADLALAYRAHLWLRTASRIQRLLADLPAGSAAELQAAAAGIEWFEYLLPKHAFAVAPILTDERARALGEQEVKAAIAAAVAGRLPDARFDEADESAVTLVAHVRAGVCTLGLDTAGRALHKRGYRLNGHPAVLKETLAASLLLLAGYDGTEALFDPMCGSGTIIIEGAYLALHKAPLIHRGKDDFAFEHQAGFDRALWRRVSNEARAAKLPAPPAPLFASDLREAFVELARATALRARVERHIEFSAANFLVRDPPAKSGLLVCNLPYGERIGQGQVPTLYKDVGTILKQRYSAWRIALLVPADAPIDALGKRPSRHFALMNGALEVTLLLFE